jgi:hypothetical protein
LGKERREGKGKEISNRALASTTGLKVNNFEPNHTSTYASKDGRIRWGVIRLLDFLCILERVLKLLKFRLFFIHRLEKCSILKKVTYY